MNRSTNLMLLLIILLTGMSISGKQRKTKRQSDILFESHIKSTDQFARRFNGEEFYPLVEKNDTNKHRTTLLSLFNTQIAEDADDSASIYNIIDEFIDSALINDCKFYLDDSLTTVLAECEFSYIDNPCLLVLNMALEEYKPKNFTWSIKDVEGLRQSGILNDNGKYIISPIANESNFMELRDLFNLNSNNATLAKSNDSPIDELSYFFGTVVAGKLKFNQCNNIKILSRAVPGFLFEISEIPNIETSNSGWLITNVLKQPK